MIPAKMPSRSTSTSKDRISSSRHPVVQPDAVCRYKRIDTLVNNASKQIKCTDMAEIDLEDVESTFRSNILQMFAITKYSLPHMREGSR